MRDFYEYPSAAVRAFELGDSALRLSGVMDLAGQLTSRMDAIYNALDAYHASSQLASDLAYQQLVLGPPNHAGRLADMAAVIGQFGAGLGAANQFADFYPAASAAAEQLALLGPSYAEVSLASQAAGVGTLAHPSAEWLSYHPSLEMLNSGVLNLTSALRSVELPDLCPKSIDLADRLGRIWAEASGETAVPLDETQAVIEEVKPYLPAEAAETLDTKITEAKTPDNKLTLDRWLAIIGILVSLLTAFYSQASSAEHEKKEEAAWSAAAEYQQENLALQKENNALQQKILECMEEMQNSRT